MDYNLLYLYVNKWYCNLSDYEFARHQYKISFPKNKVIHLIKLQRNYQFSNEPKPSGWLNDFIFLQFLPS